METKKKWVKVDPYNFTFWNDGSQIGTMEIELGKSERKAIAKFDNQTIIIKKTGFWKNKLEITRSDGHVIGTMYREKWYKSSSMLEYNHRKYRFIVRNNPLVELVIQDNNQDLLAYGLDTKDGKVCVRISTTSAKTELLFDFIIWYLFLPIASEQSADDLTFLLLIA